MAHSRNIITIGLFSLVLTNAYAAQEAATVTVAAPVTAAAQAPRTLAQINADLDRLNNCLAQMTADQNKDKSMADKLSIINRAEFVDFRSEILGLQTGSRMAEANILLLDTLRKYIDTQLQNSTGKLQEIADKFKAERVATEQEREEITHVETMIAKSKQMTESVKKLFPWAFSAMGKVLAFISPRGLKEKAFNKVFPLILMANAQGGNYQIVGVSGTYADAEGIQTMTETTEKVTNEAFVLIQKNAKKETESK